jgi:hypothetical protein
LWFTQLGGDAMVWRSIVASIARIGGAEAAVGGDRDRR